MRNGLGASYFLVLAMLTTGCAQIVENERAIQASYIERLGQRCEQFGFRRGTNEFANCMMRLEKQDSADRDASTRALLDLADQMNRQRQGRQSVQTTCFRNGAYISCDSR
jgi:hypothetical protein